jgi:phage shock protein C
MRRSAAVNSNILRRRERETGEEFSMSPQNRRLTKARDRRLAGVCGGLAEFLDWPAGRVRALWLIAGVLTGGVPALVAYALLAFVMPPPRTFNLDDFREQ